MWKILNESILSHIEAGKGKREIFVENLEKLMDFFCVTLSG